LARFFHILDFSSSSQITITEGPASLCIATLKDIIDEMCTQHFLVIITKETICAYSRKVVTISAIAVKRFIVMQIYSVIIDGIYHSVLDQYLLIFTVNNEFPLTGFVL